MPKSYSQIVTDTATYLQDSGGAIFASTDIDLIMPSGLVAISQAKPWNPPKLTKTTTADSYDITLSAGDRWRLLEGTGYKGTGIIKVEYEVDEDPRQFRGLTRFGNIISLELAAAPDSADSVYLFMNKIHLLQKEIGTTDTAGAIATAAAIGATSLALKNLGTGTINEMTTVAIAGDSTVYYVTAQATIAANTATVSIWPPLAAAAALDAVVTLSLTDSTLDVVLEGYLTRWLAATATISKSTQSYAQVNTAITTLSNAATAIAAIAALINLATTASTGDIALGRASALLGATAIGHATTGMGYRIEAAVTNIGLAKTEVGKLTVASTGLLDQINTELDKLAALLDASTGAQKELGEGRTELLKSDDLINAGGDIIEAASIGVAAMLAQITTADTGTLALARAAVAKGVLSINDTASAHTEIGKIDFAVTGPLVVAASALASGASLINTVTAGGGSREYMAQAQTDISLAQGYNISAQAYLNEAGLNFSNAAADLQIASKTLDVAMAKLQEGKAKWEEAVLDENLNRAYIESAMAKLSVLKGYVEEVQGYVLEVNTRLATASSYVGLSDVELRAAGAKAQEAAADHANAASYYAAAEADLKAAAVKAQEAVSNLNLVASRMRVLDGGLRYEEWGRRELATVQRDLLAYAGPQHSVRYPRD